MSKFSLFEVVTKYILNVIYVCVCDQCHYASKIPLWFQLDVFIFSSYFKLLHTIKQLLNLTSESAAY